MKRCQKLPEPTSLATYRNAHPDASWDEMRDDPFDSGQQAYRDIKHTLVKGQRCLCAFCEIRIADRMDDESIHEKKHMQRVEHFHPKEDRNGIENWTLKWSNVWAVCLGGSQKPPAGMPSDPRHYSPPLPENLSCDAFKDHQIKTGKLAENPEGWILAPDELAAFPPLFQFTLDGTPEPHTQNCATVTLSNNHYADTTELVSKTIQHLNLGCPRLNRNRDTVRMQLEKQIAQARERSPGDDPQTVLLGLARRLFSPGHAAPWPEFFSLIRWRAGHSAEERLREIGYDG